jgi:hypothetical protein
MIVCGWIVVLGALVLAYLGGVFGTSPIEDAGNTERKSPSVGEVVKTKVGTLRVAQYLHRAFHQGVEPVPEEGEEYRAIRVIACNRTSSSVGFDPANFGLGLHSGLVAAPAGVDAKQPALRHSPIASNRCLKGWITFAVPERERPRFAIFDAEGALSGETRTFRWRIPPH